MQYTDERLNQAARFAFEFMRLGESEDTAALKLMTHIDRLLLHIYLAHEDGRYLSKTQACRMIPAEHVETCKKYVEQAVKSGYITFEPDKSDRRRTNVVPTQKLIEYVHRRATAALKEVDDLLTAAS